MPIEKSDLIDFAYIFCKYIIYLLIIRTHLEKSGGNQSLKKTQYSYVFLCCTVDTILRMCDYGSLQLNLVKEDQRLCLDIV